MAVFCNKTSIETLRKRPSTRSSAFGYGLGGNDLTSRPQTIDQQPKAKTINSPLPKTSPVQNPMAAVDQSAPADAMMKDQINLSEQELLKMLEEV